MRHRTISFTPAAERSVELCRALAAASPAADVWTALLILTLLLDESLASACLTRLGITLAWLREGALGEAAAAVAGRHQDSSLSDNSESSLYQNSTDDADSRCRAEGSGCNPRASLAAIDDPTAFLAVLDRAREIARRESLEGVTSSVLLLAVLEQSTFVRERLAAAGATLQKVQESLFPDRPSVQPVLQVDEVLQFGDQPGIAAAESPSETVNSPVPNQPADYSNDGILRVLDACMNRAREGLRVLEDCARFVLNDAIGTEQLKSLRHELVAIERLLPARPTSESANDAETSDGLSIPSNSPLLARDTINDVGTILTHSNERSRVSMTDLVTANCRRVQESLRSLEEFGKLVSIAFSEQAKQLRYRVYVTEQTLAARMNALPCSSSPRDHRRNRLNRATLYALITESMCSRPWQQVVEAAIAGGVDILQLREKSLNDRELLRRANWLVAACRQADVLCIINDRADIAAASRADGVHVGQEELPVAAARAPLGPDRLVGVSTHSEDQIRQAITDGADYIGVGPVFPSSTKSFSDFPGLRFVQSAATISTVPFFAIGGISPQNLDDVLNAGASRVAITSAIAKADNPQVATAELQRILRSRSVQQTSMEHGHG